MTGQEHCVFCKKQGATKTFFPKHFFNRKAFEYIQCRYCQLIYLTPLPDREDYEKMYPPSYQEYEVALEILADPNQLLPGLRFSYGYQFELIRKYGRTHASILDYGCGAANFVVNAHQHGFVCEGAEFDRTYVDLLTEKTMGCKFYTVAELLNDTIQQRFDVIRLSNVLEHLTTPAEILIKLQSLLNPGGILLIEGPIEDNTSFMRFVSNCYFRVKNVLSRNNTISSAPFHIFFSNYRNQLQFFKISGFKVLHFETRENAWPMPVSVKEAKGIKRKVMAMIAQLSIKISKLVNRNWGNTFVAVIAGTTNIK